MLFDRIHPRSIPCGPPAREASATRFSTSPGADAGAFSFGSGDEKDSKTFVWPVILKQTPLATCLLASATSSRRTSFLNKFSNAPFPAAQASRQSLWKEVGN